MSERRLWWQQTDVYWHLPFFAEMGFCCEDLAGEDWNAAREQLWAIREGLLNRSEKEIK